MAKTVDKKTYINTELVWAESQLASWKAYIDDNPIHKLNYRVIFNENISKEKKHYIYCHFNLYQNRPFYVGIGTNGKTKNFARAKSTTGRNIFWKQKAKNKYLIVICSESDNYNDIKELEKEFIRLYGIESLTNLTYGGEGCKGYKHTLNHINRLKENYKIGKSALKDRKVTNIEREIKSQMYTGKGNPNYGKVGFKSAIGRPVEKILQGEDVIITFGSIRDAARNEKVSHTSIRKAIINNTRCKTFKWRYSNGN